MLGAATCAAAVVAAAAGCCRGCRKDTQAGQKCTGDGAHDLRAKEKGSISCVQHNRRLAPSVIENNSGVYMGMHDEWVERNGVHLVGIMYTCCRNAAECRAAAAAGAQVGSIGRRRREVGGAGAAAAGQ